ncbi:hypothetical protein GALL_00110 [mine drainage metagenome]|uniref:Capsule polysaccharide biosynthesis protein n=1 Tax=mine drainage metagenome TaxID=410659 RepID=A0A1J5TZB2_9ZZZZ
MTNFVQDNGLDKPAKVAIICLDGAVSLYADTLSFVAWKLRDEGVEVIRFGCGGILETCTSINSTGKIGLSGSEKERICQRCRTAQQEVTAEDSFEVNAKDGSAEENSVRFLDELKERLVSGSRVADVLDMEYAGLPLCRMAFFDYSIVTKLAPDSILDASSAARFVVGVNDLIKLFHAFERFRKQYDVTHIVYVNGNYTQNTLARYIFGEKGMICLSVEPQLTSQHILNHVMLASDRLSLHPEGLHHFDESNLSIDKSRLADTKNVLVNFGARIRGADFNAYTSLDGQAIATEEVARFEKFLETHKRITSFFLSSEDELTPHIITHGISGVANPNPLGPYRTQLEFTAYLLKEATIHPETGFVIRLHPRMAANKRDLFESQEHLRYKSLLAEISVPENVLVLYGDSKVSSYFVISESDLVVISWSTIGLEALLLGAPVISAFPCYLMYPLTMFSKQPTNQEEMEIALFSDSNFGVADDTKLLAWMGMAYEGQFFATAAPRGQGGMLGKFYRVVYRLSKKTGMLDIIYWLVNTFLLRQLIIDFKRLLHRRENGTSSAEGFQKASDRLLTRYRNKYRQLLKEYGQRIKGAQ